MVAAQMGRFYDLPTSSIVGLTDSKLSGQERRPPGLHRLQSVVHWPRPQGPADFLYPASARAETAWSSIFR